MAREIMTDERVEQEITRLKESEFMKLGRKEEQIKLRRMRYMYNLQRLERRGRQLAAEGYTLENIAERMLGDLEGIDEVEEKE